MQLMGLALMAVAFDLQLVAVILKVAIGLGLVIFVHELGHFAVAKMCGVKCEKFYLGFDIAGLKLAKFQWGETEYGIGILPLGGYVKMLGQDDNPAGEAADAERRQHEPLDPRSYKAQSVPRRMAIISAGVIMNLIFAVVFAAIAYGLGVKAQPAGVSRLWPGEAAWQADLHPGDRIVAINDRKTEQPLRFRDLTSAVIFGDPGQGVRFEIARDGVPENFWVTIKTARSKERLAPVIGVLSPQTTTLADPPVRKGSVAGEVAEFRAGDKIVAIDGQPVADYTALIATLAEHPNDALTFTVERPAAAEPGGTVRTAESKSAPAEKLEIRVPASPLQTLGLVMPMGAIAEIQQNSPAAEAGLKPGDRIVQVDGEPVGDPITFAERMRRRAGQPLSLEIERPATDKTSDQKGQAITISLTPRQAGWWEESEAETNNQAAAALGITYAVPPEIVAVLPDSPAAKAGVAPGDVVTQAEFQLPKKADKGRGEGMAEEEPRKVKPLDFAAGKVTWACFSQLLQELPPGTKIKLTLASKRSVELEPAASDEWHHPDRGFVLSPDMVTIRATSPTQAISMAVREAEESVGQVYGFLRRIGTQISPLGLGGPVAIAEQAGRAAYMGLPDLLLFLTMLSANLAVINFLPIPILDGGHMVFLILEGILRRPVNEKIVVAFHYAGLLFILSLMLFVLCLDTGIIPRQ